MPGTRTLITLGVAVVLGTMTSCGWSADDYMAVHRDGIRILPAAMQMNDHYTDVDNFIVHFGSSRQPLEWQTAAFIEGRFELTFVLPVFVDYAKRTVKSAGDAKFHLVAASKVEIRPNGAASITYDGNLQRVFGQAEWDRFVKAGFDLTVLDIPKEEIHSIPNWKERILSVRKDRVPIK